jgi:hypothetical protein
LIRKLTVLVAALLLPIVAYAAVRAVAPGTLTAINGSNLISGGTKFVATGCANSATVGGAFAGQFASGTTGTCTVTLTLPTAPNGWTCYADDRTTPGVFNQTGSSTTSCNISGATTSGDTVNFMAMGY